MNSTPKFLVKANAEDERLLYSRTLQRRFPAAVVTECDRTTTALMVAHDAVFDGAVVHFNASPEAVEFLQALRRSHPQLPIIATSGVDRSAKALAAGATVFVPASEWLTLGTRMQALLPSSHE